MLLITLIVLAISCLFAPLGCVLLWQRYNYFSDGLAHACLFSGIISYFLNLPQLLSMMVVALIFATLVFILKFYSNKNTVINLVSSTMLALAIIFASKMPDSSLIEKMLFGDILAASERDLGMIVAVVIVVFTLLIRFLDRLVIISLNTDLARVQKIPVNIIELSSLLLLSLVIALTMKIVGALLITALLIIPAASARIISRAPLHMILYSTALAVISGSIGIYISFIFDWPLAPAIAIISVAVYSLTAAIRASMGFLGGKI